MRLGMTVTSPASPRLPRDVFFDKIDSKSSITATGRTRVRGILCINACMLACLRQCVSPEGVAAVGVASL